MRPAGFTLIELLTVLALVAVLAALIFPIFAQAKEQGNKASCLANLQSLSMATTLYSADADDRFPSANAGLQNVVAGYEERATALAWVVQTYPYVKSLRVLQCNSDGSHALVEVPLSPPFGEISERSIGINGYLSAFIEPQTGSISNSQVRAVGDMVLFGDAIYLTAAHPAYYVCSGYQWPEGATTANDLLLKPNFVSDLSNPGMTRHKGGTQFAFCDGHAKWRPQGQITLQAGLLSQPVEADRYGILMDVNDPRNR